MVTRKFRKIYNKKNLSDIYATPSPRSSWVGGRAVETIQVDPR